MPNMPDHVYKGPIFKRLDALYATPAGRRTMLDALIAAEGKGSDQLARIGQDQGVFLTGGEVSPPPEHAEVGNPYRNQVDHVKNHWFGKKDPGSTDPNNGWWNDGSEVAEIIRQGAIEALKLAGDNEDSSVDVLWACFGDEPEPGRAAAAPAHGHDVVKTQVFISWTEVPGGGKRVTMLIITPEEPHDGPGVPPMKVRFEPVPPRLRSGIAVVERFDQATLPGAPNNEIGFRLCENEGGYYPKAPESTTPPA